jgi:hypothetical protein
MIVSSDSHQSHQSGRRQGCDFGLISGPDNVQRAFEPASVLDLAAPILAVKRCPRGSLQSS